MGLLSHNLSTLIEFHSISLSTFFVFNFTQTVQFQMIYVSCQLNKHLASFLLLYINLLLSTLSLAAVQNVGISVT